jgi:hypothetical protein
MELDEHNRAAQLAALACGSTGVVVDRFGTTSVSRSDFVDARSALTDEERERLAAAEFVVGTGETGDY